MLCFNIGEGKWEEITKKMTNRVRPVDLLGEFNFLGAHPLFFSDEIAQMYETTIAPMKGYIGETPR